MPCASRKPGVSGALCRYVETEPQSREELVAWEIILACQGQVRLTGTGSIIGFDVQAVHQITQTLQADDPAILELVFSVESALVKTFNDTDD